MTMPAPTPDLRPASLAIQTLVWLGLILGLAPFLWAFGFCFPRGDDFDEVTRAMFLFDLPGGLYEIGREWLTWSGRYTYHFLAVFLGKAGEIRWLAGLVCATVLALHGLIFYGFARQFKIARSQAIPLAFLALLALCASWQHLWTYYMLTDALTSGLQGACALGFFWALCALWMHLGEGAAIERCWRRRASLLGVLAVGVYEHSALAVLTGAALACALAWFQDRQDSIAFRSGRLRIFLQVALCCLLAALFSFLAPGNLYRKQVRGIDAETVRRQLEALPADWLQTLASFAQSLWPIAAVLLALILALLCGKGFSEQRLRRAIFMALLLAAGFCFGSFSLGVLHALSDQPLLANPKLPANIGFYAALALGFASFALLRASPFMAAASEKLRIRAALLTGAILLLFCFASDNFQLTFRNAVNGAMTLYARVMTSQDAVLRQAASLSPQGDYRFGLVGEVLYPGSRARKLDPKARWTLVCQWRQAVFPVFSGGDVSPPHAADWPNLWIAWMYGLDAVAGALPQPKAAIAALKAALNAGPGGAAHAAPDLAELRLPPEAQALGLARAWRINAQGGPNPGFAFNWLVLESQKALPNSLSLLVPSPVVSGRMAPKALQFWLLERLLREESARPRWLSLLAAPRRDFAASAWLVEGKPETGFHYAFPLGPSAPMGNAPEPGNWPSAIFVRLDGQNFLRLEPSQAAFLDTAPEN